MTVRISIYITALKGGGSLTYLEGPFPCLNEIIINAHVWYSVNMSLVSAVANSLKISMHRSGEEEADE